MNSSTNSESALLSTPSAAKIKQRENKENKLQRFGGAVVNALNGGLVFGKIKSLWSHSNTNMGLNILADSDRLQKSKSKERLGLRNDLRSNCFVFDCFSFSACIELFFSIFFLVFARTVLLRFLSSQY